MIAVSSPSGIRGGVPNAVAFCCFVCSQNASGCSIFWFFGQHCNEWQNESQSRLTSNLVSVGNLCHLNIIVVQTGKLIFAGPKIEAPLNFAALFGRTPGTCLRSALCIHTVLNKLDGGLIGMRTVKSVIYRREN